MNSVEVNDLTKVYQSRVKKRNVTALKNFNLTVESGSVFGLLGPNGAGKTTLIKILLGITFPTAGSAKILETDINDFQIKKRVGYLPENHKFPPYLTAEQVLRLVADLCGYEDRNLDKKIDELLSLVKMTKWKKTKVKKYSKGMMQRLGLAQAMINDPDLIFLDEPTDGVDPIGRKEIRDIIQSLKDSGKTIFLNSHLLSEVELITDRVAILNKGTLIQEGKVEDITTDKEVYKIKVDKNLSDELLNGNLSGFSVTHLEDNTYTAKVNDVILLNKLIDAIRQNSINIISILPQKKSLEDMFISLINESDKKNSQ